MSERRPWSPAPSSRQATSTIEGLLEAALGKPQEHLRDMYIELDLVERQAALLSNLLSSEGDVIFSSEEVELLLDALDEFAGRSIVTTLHLDWLDEGNAPPQLAREDLAAIIALCGPRSGSYCSNLVHRTETGLAAEQRRLRALIASRRKPAADLRLVSPSAARTEGGT